MTFFDHNTATLHPAISVLGIVGTVVAGATAPTQNGILIAAVASVLTILIQQLGSWLNQRRVSGDKKDQTASERIADLEKKYDAALDELYKREAQHSAQITRLRAGIVRALRLFDSCDRASCPQYNSDTASERQSIEQLLYDIRDEDEDGPQRRPSGRFYMSGSGKFRVERRAVRRPEPTGDTDEPISEEKNELGK